MEQIELSQLRVAFSGSIWYYPSWIFFYRCKVDMFSYGVITHSSFHGKKGGGLNQNGFEKGVLFCLFVCFYQVLVTSVCERSPKVLACLGYQLELKLTCILSTFREQPTTFIPSLRTRCSQISAPIPAEAPVTSATRPAQAVAAMIECLVKLS